MLLYIDFPSWLTPEVFGAFQLPAWLGFLKILRWYGIAYIVGIAIAYYQMTYILKKDPIANLDKKRFDDYLFWGIIGLVLGGRIFSCLVYDFEIYSKNPLGILIPFHNGQFVGFQGMAYHGAVIGVLVVSLIFVRKYKIDFRSLCDVVFPAIPLGYTLGRIANFINGELWGRITSSPIGVLFPDATKLPLTLPEVQQTITDLGWNINTLTGTALDRAGNDISGVIAFVGSTQMINLPRYPSQLFEALLEGIVLFLILWFPARKFKPFKGFTAPVYLAGYSVFRLMLEFFRQPDSQFADLSAGKYHGFIFAGVTMGQILSVLMIIGSIWLFFYFRKLSFRDVSSRNQSKNDKLNDKLNGKLNDKHKPVKVNNTKTNKRKK